MINGIKASEFDRQKFGHPSFDSSLIPCLATTGVNQSLSALKAGESEKQSHGTPDGSEDGEEIVEQDLLVAEDSSGPVHYPQ